MVVNNVVLLRIFALAMMLAGAAWQPVRAEDCRRGVDSGCRLTILDDWGLAPITAEQRRDLLEIMEDRYGRRSTMVTSQLPVEHWHEIIGDPTLADAILDRLVHNAHRLTLKGESLRKAAAKRQTLDDKPAN